MEKYSLEDLDIFKTRCEDFNHKDQTVEYILLSKDGNFKTRLLCRKCIKTNFNQHTHEVCLIDNVNLDFTGSFQWNINQILCDFIYSYDFKFDQQAITSKIDEIRKNFLYQLLKLERKLIENYQQFSACEDQFFLESQKQIQQNNFIQSLNEAGNKCESLTPKDKKSQEWMQINMFKTYILVVSKMIQNNIRLCLKQLKKLKTDLIERIHYQDYFKSDWTKDQKKYQKKFRIWNKLSVNLNSDLLNQLIERINPIFKKATNFQDKIQRIYQSKYDGLNSKLIYDKILKQDKLDMQNLLFIFKTSSFQTFGVWVNQNSSILFHQDKQQEFQIKADVKPFIMVVYPEDQ